MPGGTFNLKVLRTALSLGQYKFHLYKKDIEPTNILALEKKKTASQVESCLREMLVSD